MVPESDFEAKSKVRSTFWETRVKPRSSGESDGAAASKYPGAIAPAARNSCSSDCDTAHLMLEAKRRASVVVVVVAVVDER